MEERYINTPSRSGRRTSPQKRRPKVKRKSVIGSALKSLYLFVVAISAVIVVGYVGFHVMVTPPDQVQPKLPDASGQQTENPGGGAASVPDVNALVRKDGVYNILLAGTDNDGFRTDTMMVMSYDTKNQTVGVISVPRDTITDRAAGKHPKLVYGPGGVDERRAEISDMLGVPIDYYIKVNLKGFIALVDYVGGVNFYVPCNMSYDDPYQNLSIHYKKGQQDLSGQQAMEVARFRKNNDLSGYNDNGRTDTQQKLLVALAKKVLAWKNLTRINGFVEIFNKYVDTDLALNDMLYFASQAIYIDTGTGVETYTLEGDGEVKYRGYKYCYELNLETTLDAVNRLINPYTRDLTLDDMNIMQG